MRAATSRFTFFATVQFANGTKGQHTGRPRFHSCEHCKALRDSTKTLRIRFLPEVLCIHLKRFKYDDYIPSKISTPVVFPLEGLSLRPYLSNHTPQTHSIYDLVAIINHRGGVGGMLANCATE